VCHRGRVRHAGRVKRVWTPPIRGEIERRLLVNYRVDPDVIARVLPAPFRPKMIQGSAVAGICLIRLGAMRPAGLPPWIGLRSENAAHRVAVEWGDPTAPRSGVYIPRRDSNSWANIALGGRIYPGEHHRARFEVTEAEESMRVAFTANDGSTHVDVSVQLAQRLGDSALFASVEEASTFFEKGSVGYSATHIPTRFDGLQLLTTAWQVEPAVVLEAHSSFFDDQLTFPSGTAELDCVLVMQRVPVDWVALDDVDSAAPVAL
jgi:hypothetical protein